MGILDNIFEAAIDYGIKKIEEVTLEAGREIGKNFTQERIENELSERAKRNQVLNLLVEFRNTHERGEFADCLLYGMMRKFNLTEDVSDEYYLKTFRGINYGSKNDPVSAFAFYNGQQLLVSGRINEDSFGVSVAGKGSYNLCVYIARFLKTYEAAVRYSVVDNLRFYDKKIYMLADQLVHNPAQDGSIYGGIEEMPEYEEEEEDLDEDDESYEEGDDEEDLDEDDDYRNEEDAIIELCQFFKIEYSSLNKTILKKSYYTMMTQYHPDKVNTLADDFKELAEKKTKEINEKYECLLAWIKQKENINPDNTNE